MVDTLSFNYYLTLQLTSRLLFPAGLPECPGPDSQPGGPDPQGQVLPGAVLRARHHQRPGDHRRAGGAPGERQPLPPLPALPAAGGEEEGPRLAD